eukprot:163021-Pyramimonas_sp.AAC.1
MTVLAWRTTSEEDAPPVRVHAWLQNKGRFWVSVGPAFRSSWEGQPLGRRLLSPLKFGHF